MSSKLKTKFACQNCGYSSPKWLGKCPDCGMWNTMVEEIVNTAKLKSDRKSLLNSKSADLVLMSEVKGNDEPRLKTGIEEFDRVLGGGIVAGSVVLIGGDPGIGKSTLMLQVADKIKNKKILYVSGE